MSRFRAVVPSALVLAAGAAILLRLPLAPLPAQAATSFAPALVHAAAGPAALPPQAAGLVPAVFEDAAPAVRSIPYGVGERATYRVSYNVVGRVGTGEMSIVGVDTIRGRPAFHIVNTLQGRVLFARVNNRFESWLDVADIYSHRFEQSTHEINFRRHRTREFFPSQRRWTGQTNSNRESGPLSTAQPLDDTSFLYFVRTLDLQVGREYTFNRYWNPEGNPVRVQVLRHERVTVPAGTFNTLVLRPIIQTSGMFSEGGEAEVYFNVDGARQLVMLRARVSFGTLQLQLEEFQRRRG
jgi:hypothetical protein